MTTITPQHAIGSGFGAGSTAEEVGHFALAGHLWPALVAGGGARVVALSSTGHKRSGIRWDDVMFAGGSYEKWTAYGQAKSANSLFAVHLDDAGREHGVRAFAAHPGGILTPLQRHLTTQEMVDRGWIDEEGTPLHRFKTPEQGAATATWAATSPQLDGLGGVYCEDCEIAEPTDVGGETEGVSGVNAHAVDRDDAARLWALSAELTGVDPLN